MQSRPKTTRELGHSMLFPIVTIEGVDYSSSALFDAHTHDSSHEGSNLDTHTSLPTHTNSNNDANRWFKSRRPHQSIRTLIIVISRILSPCYSTFGTPEELGRCFIAPARLHHPIESLSMPAFLAANFHCRECSQILLLLTDYHDGFLGLSEFLHHWIRTSSLLSAFWAG